MRAHWTFVLLILFVSLLNSASAIAADCNGNGIDDTIDISTGFSQDCNGNGIPDECDLIPAPSYDPPVSFPVDSNPFSVASGDLDGVNGLDLVTANNGVKTVSILLNNGNGTYAPAVNYLTDGSNFSVAVADFDGDTDLDLAAATKKDTVSVLFNNGNGTFSAGGIFPTLGDRPTWIASGDLDGVNGPDVVVASRNSLNVSVLLNDGSGNFGPAVTYATGDTSRYVAIGDADGINGPDLLVANKQSDTVSVLLNNGDGTFAPAVNYAAGNGPTSIALADLDGDLDLDVAVVNTGSDQIRILLNNGNGTYAFSGVFPVGFGPLSVVGADLDGDGDNDLGVTNFGTVLVPGNTVSVLLNNGAGAFPQVAAFATGSSPISIIAGDVDGDSTLDLVTSHDLALGVVSVLRGRLASFSQDCNGNGRPDECDIILGQGALALGQAGPGVQATGGLKALHGSGQSGLAQAAVAGGGGPVFLSGDDADDIGHCQGTACGGLYTAVLSFAVANSTSPGTGIVAIGVNGGAAATALNSWNDVANGGPGAAVTILTDPAVIATVDFSAFGVLYIPSSSLHTVGGISTAQLDALNARQVDVVNFVNVLGGGLIALTEANTANAYGWLPIAIETADQLHTNVCPTLALTAALAPAATCANMSHGFYHNVFTGPPGFLGMDVLATSADAPLDQAVLLGGANVVIGGQILLTPDTATNPVDTQHTVTASVQDGLPPFAPIPGVQVTFDVLSGPNVGDTGTAITDVAGMADFSYPGDGGAGLDQIQAQFTDANGTHFSNTVTKTWIGGQINLAPNTVTIGLGNPHTLTATALQGTAPFGPLAGVSVTFDIIAGPDIGDSGTGITDAGGVATFVYTGHNGEGVDQIQASFTDSAGTHVSNIVTANWLQGSKDCNGNGIPDECESASAFADLDMDGDVDSNDFLTFSNCFNGALNTPTPSCGNLCADLDRDGDVDGGDFLTFSNCFNGALNPPNCP